MECEGIASSAGGPRGPRQRRDGVAEVARAADLHISVCAVLLAEACNISLTDVAHPSVPALSYNRLSWVSQNYVRTETIAAANELLLSAYRRIPLVQSLGDGHIATVDGMRFQVPVRSIHVGPNPRYFARGRGLPAELAAGERRQLRGLGESA